MKPKAFGEIFVLVPRATAPADPSAGSGTLDRHFQNEIIEEVDFRLIPVIEEFGISVTNLSNVGNVYGLCGVPGICRSRAEESCYNITLDECKDCPTTYLGVFIFFSAVLGAAYLMGNSLVLQVVHSSWKKGNLSNIDKFRASLALADIIAGFLIGFVTLPNVFWTKESTIEDIIIEQQPVFQNSPQAIVGGTIYILGYMASLYNLLVFGAFRLYAIQRPQKYQQMSSRKVHTAIATAWILAMIVSSIPGWFPQYLSFDYNHVTFLYLPTLNVSSTSTTFIPGVLWLCLTVFVPYILLTGELIFTAILVSVQVSTSRKTLKFQSHGKKFSKQEISAFKTVALMQFGFTITLIPIGIVLLLFYVEYLTCNNFSTPYLVAFYLSLTNSLANILIYSMREQKFRMAISESFRKLNSTISSRNSHSRQQSQPPSNASR